jgi:hypothetical protein
MTITVEAVTGSKSSLSTTEWSLNNGSSTIATSTTGGVWQAMLDLNAMSTGDTFRFAVYEKCRTGDTQRKVYTAEFSGAQGNPLWVSPSLILGAGWDMTLIKVAGTDRTINWRISKVA